jgi:hypothetical protein
VWRHGRIERGRAAGRATLNAQATAGKLVVTGAKRGGKERLKVRLIPHLRARQSVSSSSADGELVDASQARSDCRLSTYGSRIE